MGKHAVKDATPQRAVFAFILWWNSDANVIYVLLIGLGDIYLIEVANFNFNISMDNMDVDDELFVFNASYQIFVDLSMRNLICG